MGFPEMSDILPMVAVQGLLAVIGLLSPNDQSFAHSLCAQFHKKGLTDKQMLWVHKLSEKATAPKNADLQGANIGNVKPIVDLLETAKQYLKFPAIVVRANDRDFRLNIAGAVARHPGTINVCSAERGAEGRDWYGRISRDGTFQPSPRIDTATGTAVAAALTAMAANPARAAAEYGHLTGVCCFCSRPLTDDRSTAVGYGKVCASHYGLPWG